MTNLCLICFLIQWNDWIWTSLYCVDSSRKSVSGTINRVLISCSCLSWVCKPMDNLVWKCQIFMSGLVLTILFFSFHWHYSPLSALACRTISFHFFPICHQLSPSSHSQHLKISFYFLFPSLSGSSPSRLFQFLSEDLFGHPILLHSL